MKETKKYQICLIDGTNFMFSGEQANHAQREVQRAGIYNNHAIDLNWDKEQIKIFVSHIAYAKKIGDWGNTNEGK